MRSTQFNQKQKLAILDSAAEIGIKKAAELAIDDTLLNLAEYTNREHKSPFLMRYPAISIISTRGCPGKCVYGIL